MRSDADILPKLLNLIVGFLAIALICVSIVKPWFALPLYSFDESSNETLDSSFTFYFKIALVALIVVSVLLVGLSYRFGWSWRRILLRGSILGGVVSLWFPTVLAHRDIEVMGEAAWLQQQFDTMTWLGGDVYRAHSERSVELGTGVNAQDPPDRLALFKPPVNVGWTQINDWLWWFGYGPSFTQFVSSGWFYAVIGFLLLAIAICGESWRRSVREARMLFKMCIIFLVKVCAVFVLVTVVTINVVQGQLVLTKQSIANGDYVQAQKALHKATRMMPTLLCDTGVIWQMGYIDTVRGNSASVSAQLYQIQSLEKLGYYDRARSILDKLASGASNLSSYHAREVKRQQLRVAINNINSGRYSRAMQYLDSLLDHQENCLQAQFHRQLLALQTGDLVMNRTMHVAVCSIVDTYRSKTKRGVKAASSWMLSQGEMRSGHVKEAWRARRKSQGK